MRSTVKIIDIWQIEALDTVPERQLFARTPLLYNGNNTCIERVTMRRSNLSQGAVLLVDLLQVYRHYLVQ